MLSRSPDRHGARIAQSPGRTEGRTDRTKGRMAEPRRTTPTRGTRPEDSELESLRRKIDAVDLQILEKLNARAR